MKKSFISLVALAALLPALVSAQVSTGAQIDVNAEVRVGGTTRPALKARVDAAKEMLVQKRDAAQARAAELRAEVNTHFGAGVERAVNNILGRLGQAADHLTNIAARIETYIQVKQDAGLPMEASVEALAAAQTNIAAAQDKIAEASVVLSAALAADTPREEMARVRAAVKAAEDALKTAKRSLQNVLSTIRADIAAGTQVEVQ